MFSKCGCQTIGDHHDLYLTSDSLLLAYVFEALRVICYDRYGMDCAQCYGASNLSGDAFLKVCKPDLHLLTEREQLELVENMMRRGLSSNFARRLFKQTTAICPTMMLLNHLHMRRCQTQITVTAALCRTTTCHCRIFQLASQIKLDEILVMSPTTQHGYIFEVDMDYQPTIYGAYQDFPLVPSKLKIKHSRQSVYKKQLKV